MLTSKTEIPGFFCSDEAVQQFCERELWNFSESRLRSAQSARQLLKTAQARFGTMDCWDLEFYEH